MNGKTRKKKKIELKELEKKANNLQKKISAQRKENIKQLNKRNFKLVKHTAKFTLPLVLTTSATVGVFRLFGLGFPCYVDDIKMYKTYNLDYQSNGYVQMDEEYSRYNFFDDHVNSLIVYMPWKKYEDGYKRLKQTYKVDKISLDLYNEILNKNYDYIFNNLILNSEEEQFINVIDESKNDTIVRADLRLEDKEDVLKYNETDLRNTIVTISEILIILIGGAVVEYNRTYDYMDYIDSVKQANKEYKNNVAPLKPIKQDLKETNEKIKILSKSDKR